jgi:hypothetical protein
MIEEQALGFMDAAAYAAPCGALKQQSVLSSVSIIIRVMAL